jgi:hypothetical protein
VFEASPNVGCDENIFQATEQVGKQLESLIAFKTNVQVYSIWNFVVF